MSESDRGAKSSWRQFRKVRLSSKRLDRRARRFEKNALRHAHRFVTSRLDHLAEVKRDVIGWIVLVLLLVGLSAVQWGLFRGAYADQVPAEGGTYSEGVLGPLETLNPLFARSSAERSAARLLFARLYRYDEGGSLKGDLAERVDVNQSGTEYTVTMRQGLRWSDGQPLTARDVVFSAQLIRDPRVGVAVEDWGSVKVDALDDRKIRFTITAAYSPFLHTLTFPVVPHHVLKDVAASELREHPFSVAPTVSSGPFAFRLLQSATGDGTKRVLHLVRNEHYHRGATLLDRFQLYVYHSRQDIAKGLRTSEIIATPDLTYASQSEEIRRSYGVRGYAIHNGVYALFNMKSGSLQSRSVRQALARSVDRTALRSQMPRMTEVLTGPLLPEHIRGELPSPVAHSVAEARELLDGDGWKLRGELRYKDGAPLKLSLVALRGAEFENAANYLATVWRKELGVEAEVRIVDPSDPAQSVLQTILRPRNFDVLIHEFALGADPDVYAYWHSSRDIATGLNFSGYANAAADDALVAGRGALVDPQKSDRYRAFVRRWQADVPALALYRPMMEYIQLPSARAVGPRMNLVSAADRYENVMYWSVRQQPVYKTP